MKKKAIMIGAGQIGRGFIGQMLADSGFEVVFMDVAQALVDGINTAGSYQVYLLGEETTGPRTITGVRAVNSTSAEAAEEFRDAALVATACGPNVLPKIAPLIAEGIRKRQSADNREPMDVIACENMTGGSRTLKGYVYEQLNIQEQEFCEVCIGFPNCEVSRIVVPTKDLPPLAVKVEKYKEWIVDSAAAVSDLSMIKGLELSTNVEAYVARKIFSLTGHAMLGYLGYAAGHKTISEAVYDYDIFQTVWGALKECAAAWSARYGLCESEFMDYCALMLIRFADQRVADPVTRPAREPIRKLALTERFFGPAQSAVQYGIEPKYIMEGIKAACAYQNPEDTEAVLLQKMIREKGIIGALCSITGLPQDHVLMRMLSNA